ncbi:MAG: DUF2971 domain-containing protein [Eubacterium sp.]|nr:DUF2971 domain-containing protein [Eubacterium sp.]
MKTEEWKKDLRKNFIIGMIGNSQEKDIAAEQVGYCYTCYAPNYLYKYYSDNPERLETIKSNKMWYSAPCKFNDVFDCDISIDEKGVFNSFLKSIPDKRGIKPGSSMWLKIKKEVHSGISSLYDFFEGLKKSMGISCFSESPDSLLMWAHYANNHRGICVEYELLEISNMLNFSPVPVIYDNEKTSFNYLNENTIDSDSTRVFVESITSKSPEWSYEKEWRIIRDEGACGSNWDTKNNGALLEMIRPHSIILGCQAEQDYEKLVHKYCEENRINLYKMKKDPQLYKLIKTPILTYDE